MKAYERFLEYVKINTQADPKSGSVPSTEGQTVLAKMLVEELKSLGVENAYLDDSGVVYGKIKGNANKACKTVGFIAHLDTSPDMSGENVRSRIVKNYDGGRIELSDHAHMDPSTFPNLENKVGHDLIVTDGTTLLGADNKAGIAIIMSFVERIMKGDILHGDISIAFTPDEEIGRGADNFDVEAFGADIAYTVDGGDISVFEYENFNAASANVVVNGSSIHPGYAKGKMKNAILLAMEFQSLLPAFMNPAYTEKYEGFYHITDINGMCEKAEMEYIIRNHDDKLFNEQKEFFMKAAEFMNAKYGENTFEVSVKDSYYNMRKMIEKDMTVVDIALEAMREIGITPQIEPIRGGTDGARLTYMGLPCPNIGTGGYNFHGKYEYLSINEMDKSVELITRITGKLISN
ncbi:MAG TPA: peptidase T [Clostridiaceae bacterium]|jgi:tripeptide aminopeptidase|nr:peptidase T [Clostridiaceae bacterium]